MEPVITLQHVSKSFELWEDRPDSLKRMLAQFTRGHLSTGQKHVQQVLEDVSFQIRPGEFVGIMGRNGAGKSTIMKIIAGIYKPDNGIVSVNGRVAPLLELGAGFAYELSGRENIYLNASILGYSNHTTRQLYEQIVEFSGLDEMIHRPVKKYSSGMLVRLGFSIAAHLDAPILLFDEILAVGDIGFQEKCVTRIHELHKQGRAIILITHSPESVAQHCDRCIVISQRKVAFDGRASEGAEFYQQLFKASS